MNKTLNYCSNCGQKIVKCSSICSNCFLDPKIPEEIIDQELNKNIFSAAKNLQFDMEYPGERTSLVFSILIGLVIGFLFSVFTIGVFIFLFIMGIVYLRIKENHMRFSLLKITENSNSKLHKLVKIAAFRLGIPEVPVYIQQESSLNAFTIGFWGNNQIVIYSGLLDILSPEEILFVLGHEMGHIKREHTTWLSLLSPARNYSIPVISDGMKVIFNNWSLKAEYSADRGGLIATRDLNNSISALLRLIGKKENINFEEYIKEFETKASDPIFKVSEYFIDHPYIPNRIKKLQQFSKNKPELIGG